MSLRLSTPAAAAVHARLSPYVRHAVEEAARFAASLHADELSIEHLFSALLADEDSAAAQVVLHAFADPETIAAEILALCPGITVVGSSRCLPFSARGVALLERARGAAASEGAAHVEPAHLWTAALAEVPDAIRAALTAAGAKVPPTPGPAQRGEEPVSSEGALFRAFSSASKRALSAAGHQAARLGREAISPAHVLLGCLEADQDLSAASNVSASRARLAIGGGDADDTPPPARALEPNAALIEFLWHCEEGSDSLALLARLLEEGEPELRQLFQRQKVVLEVVERCRGVLKDPAPAGR